MLRSDNRERNLGMRRKYFDKEGYVLWEDLRLDEVAPPSFFPAFVLKLKERIFGAAKQPACKSKQNIVRTGEKRKKASFVFNRLKDQLRSPEFWLGVSFGIVTRLATKMTIYAAFEPSQRFSATVIGVFACAFAGLAAGMAVHFVRTHYRNFKAVPGAQKEKYFTKALIESAFIGLFGGIIGGGVTNAGTMFMSAGSFATGATAGGTVGILHAGLKGMKSQGHDKGLSWGRLVFQGIAFGAVGGILGSVSYDLFGANASVAANVGQAGDVVYVPSASPQYVGDPCGYGCGRVVVPMQPVQVAPIHTVPVPPPNPPPVEAAMDHPIQPAKPPIHHHAHKPAATHPQQHCKTYTRPHKHVRVRHMVKPKPVEVKQTYVPPPPPPPQTIVPIAKQPVYYIPQNPCAAEACDIPCQGPVMVPVQMVPAQMVPAQSLAPIQVVPAQPMQQMMPVQGSYIQGANQVTGESPLNIKGPCSNPNTPCDLKIVYDQDNIAQRAVLEPSSTAGKPDFANAKGVATDRPYYMKTAQVATETKVASVTDQATKVISMPFDIRTGGPVLVPA